MKLMMNKDIYLTKTRRILLIMKIDMFSTCRSIDRDECCGAGSGIARKTKNIIYTKQSISSKRVHL
jgi:hypothetical protein